MSEKIAILASVGAVGALITAIGISNLFIGFATETYTIAIEQAGAQGYEASVELDHLLREEEYGGDALRMFLARSVRANGGLVYTKNRKCDHSCKSFECMLQTCGWRVFLASGLSHISYENGKVQIPPPKLSLWIYALMAGAITGGGVGSKNKWGRFLSVAVIAVICGALVWLLIAPQSPANTTILLGGATGGAMAFIVNSVSKAYKDHYN